MAPIADSDYPLLHLERISQYVSLSPAALSTPLPALCASVFSPLLLSYFPPARGIVLAYEDVALSDAPPASSRKSSSKQPTPVAQDGEIMLRHIDEYSAPFLWATATFLVWRPRTGAWIDGRITHQSKTHITLSHLNIFPVSILREHLPADWTWSGSSADSTAATKGARVADEVGEWHNAEGETIGLTAEGETATLHFRVRDFDGRVDGKGRGKGFLRLEGSLLSEEEEKRTTTAKGKGTAKVGGGLKRTMQAQGEDMQID
jgi:DNA-directed RNA polymerase I subunit RPA43